KKNTQHFLAETLNLKRANIAKWETGKATPDPQTLSKLANYFNVSIDYLAGKTDEKTSLIEGVKNEEAIYLLIEIALKKEIPIHIIKNMLEVIELRKSAKEEVDFILDTIKSDSLQLQWHEAHRSGNNSETTDTE
ncbi:TPA: helix-turn-helix transcriptional regulator, partial [Streptococcus suis]|nr:helix-turn-helix transcriptional regulator [Streptococcus suis]